MVELIKQNIFTIDFFFYINHIYIFVFRPFFTWLGMKRLCTTVYSTDISFVSKQRYKSFPLSPEKMWGFTRVHFIVKI